MQHNPHYDEGRLEPENVEYIPASRATGRHPESAEETRRGEGWPVRRQDGKDGGSDANWARQNDRYMRCGIHTIQPKTF